MVYVVQYFNPIGNCECVEHVEAENPLMAAFITHASNWTPQKEFDFNDYDVSEYYPDYIINESNVKWNKEESLKALEKAKKDYVIEQWKWCYIKNNDIDELVADCNRKFSIEREAVENIIKDMYDGQ